MASQRGHSRNDIRQAQRQFMFVPHDEDKGRCRSGARRDMNRHVQRNSRPITPSYRDIPLRVQLRFRTSDWDMPHVPGASPYAKHNMAPSSESESSNEGTLDSPTPSMSLSPWNDPREAEHVHFYHDVVSGQLGGAVTSAFWERYVLQRIQQQPVIKKALVALSLAYKELCDVSRYGPPRAISARTQAGHATVKAMRGLRGYLQYEGHPLYDYDVALACAVLLFALDKTRGEYEASKKHLTGAIATFRVWSERLQGRDIPAEYKVLRSVIILLDGNACIEDDTRPPLYDGQIIEFSGHADDLRFDRVEDMRDDLKIRVCHPLIRLMMQCHDGAVEGMLNYPPHVLQEKARLERELKKWRAAFDYFTWDRSSITKPRGVPAWDRSEEVARITVKIHYLVVKCTLAEMFVSIPSDANAWDKHASKILKKAERVLELLKALHGPFRINNPNGRQRAMIITTSQTLPAFAQQTTLLDMRRKANRLYADLEPYTSMIAICPGLRNTQRWRGAGNGSTVFSRDAALLLTLGSRS